MVYDAMAACGSLWSRATVAKTMLRMTCPARRPPYLQLERVGMNRYRGYGCVPGIEDGLPEPDPQHVPPT